MCPHELNNAIYYIATAMHFGFDDTVPLRGIKDWVNEDAYYGNIWNFDLVLRKWELLRTVTLSLSERFG